MTTLRNDEKWFSSGHGFQPCRYVRKYMRKFAAASAAEGRGIESCSIPEPNLNLRHRDQRARQGIENTALNIFCLTVNSRATDYVASGPAKRNGSDEAESL
jgi:hypothetical protein